MLADLLPLGILIVLAVVFALGSLVVASAMGPASPNPTKLAAYESGNEPLARVKGVNFAVKFYVVAMLFLIFDVEIVFIFPWAVVMRELAWAGFAAMAIFLGVLGVALLYEIRRGGLEWD